jgi:hypothetical protein
MPLDLLDPWPPRIAVYTTPYLRVALAANAAKKRYCPFTVGDVTPEMVAPEIHFYAAEGTGMVAVFPIEVWREDDEVHVVFDREIPSSHGPGATGKLRIYLEKVR